jgi:hypothetical protein
MYVDDVNDLQAGGTYTNDSVDWTVADWGVGGDTDATDKFGGYLADLYLNTVTSLDLSVESNRRKFITSSLKPVDLGADGARPTGTSPILFLSGGPDLWHTNRGSGGGMTLNGALTAAPSNPG